MLFDLHPKEESGSLFGRESDLENLVRHIESRRWVSLFGPRMVGKTSLVKAASYELQRKNFETLYVSLWGADSVRGFLDAVLLSLKRSTGLFSKVRRQLEAVEALTFGPLGVTLGKTSQPVSTASQLLSVLGSHADNLFVVLDEIQELASVSAHLHRILANVFVTHPGVVFCFTGSQAGLVKSLQHPGAQSPLYGRSPAEITIAPFDRFTAENFLQEGFVEMNRSISKTQIKEAVGTLGGIPGWLTYYGNSVAVSGKSHEEALKATEKEAFKTSKQTLDHLFDHRNRDLYMLTMRAIATTASWGQIKSAIAANSGRVPNDGQLKSIIDALTNAWLVEKRDNVYDIIDPVLRRYVQTIRTR